MPEDGLPDRDTATIQSPLAGGGLDTVHLPLSSIDNCPPNNIISLRNFATRVMRLIIETDIGTL